MAKASKPRAGSLQYWPRKKARKILPSVNWHVLEEKQPYSKSLLLGFIAYKAGMLSAIVKDNTADSMTKGKNILMPLTALELPPMKVLAVRLYKNDKSALDIVAPSLEKELKRKIYLPKKETKKLEEVKPENFDNIRLICYSIASKTGIKKTPDIAEIGLKGNMQEKFEFVKSVFGKEINAKDVFDKNLLVDVHAVTKGKGLVGPVKRYGIKLKQHKSEKGVRRPGSLGPWHPAHVSFRAPMAGQLGFFTRTQYNNKIIELANINEKNINPDSGLKNYGIIKTDYLLLKGYVAGPAKRQLLLTLSSRPKKERLKENFELLRIEK